MSKATGKKAKKTRLPEIFIAVAVLSLASIFTINLFFNPSDFFTAIFLSIATVALILGSIFLYKEDFAKK